MKKKDRLLAHVEHLGKAFPTPYPVSVLFVPKLAEDPDPTWRVRGVTRRQGRRIWIILDRRFPRWAMHDTLNHEWAHALDWRPESVERMRIDQRVVDNWSENAKALRQYEHEQVHDDHFYLDLGRIERAWESWEV